MLLKNRKISSRKKVLTDVCFCVAVYTHMQSSHSFDVEVLHFFINIKKKAKIFIS